jgi:hypothetical protein
VRVNARGAVGRLKDEAGQTFAEFVIVVPMMLMIFYMIITAGVGFSRYLRITDAAQVGARAAAVARFNVPPESTDPCTFARERAMESVGGLASKITVSCSAAGPVGTPFTVTVTHVYTVKWPFFDRPVYTFDITSEATSRLQ